jgi:hypothetical protein
MSTPHDPLNTITYGNVTTGNGGTASTHSVFGSTYDLSTYDLDWSDITIDTTIGNATTSGAIHVNGDAIFKGNITWQDRDMREWFESIESRLCILRPNPELEAEWSELNKLRTQYVELERELLEKQRTFDILNKP